MWVIKRFNKDDFENADRIDKIYMAIVQPKDFVLSNTDFQYLQMLERLFVIISKAVEEKEKKMLIASNAQAFRAQANQIYDDLQRLYGYFDNTLNKHIAKMNFQRAQYRIIEKMEALLESDETTEEQKIKAAEAMRKTWETLAKFYNFEDDNNKKQNINIPKITRTVHAIYTKDDEYDE